LQEIVMPSLIVADPDWKDGSQYRSLLGIPPEAFAWEFLRRNLEFRAGTMPFAHWGLRFR
jgi:hypothetical protein